MESLIRYPDWKKRLEIAISERMKRTFQWGEHDCCIVTFDLVNAMTGHDLFPYQGQYNSLESMLELSKSIYGVPHSPETFALHVLGESQQASAARVGDVMCFEKDKWNSIGTLTAMGAMFCAFDGMIFMSPSKCKCSWKID